MKPEERLNKIKEFLFPFSQNVEFNQNYSITYSLDELSDKLDNLFFCGGVKTPKTWWEKRTTDAKDIGYKNYFVIDIDLRKNYAKLNWCNTENVADEQLYEQINSLKDVIATDKLLSQWTRIVFTGNWCHIYYWGKEWKIWEELSIDEYYEWVMYVYKNWNKFFNDICWEFNYFYTDNSTANVDRILRLPYSYNAKPTNPGWRKIPVKVLYEQEVWSDMLWELKEYSWLYREYMKTINSVEYKDEPSVKVDSGFMNAFVDVCDKIPIRDVLDKLWVRYSWHSIYEWDRKTSWWKIWNNCVVNFSDDVSDEDRPQGWWYSFVKKYLKHQERKETVAWFKNNFSDIKKWAEDNSSRFEKDGVVIPDVKYDSSMLAAKLPDPIFDVLWCIYKWDVATLVAEGNSWKTTFALDIVRRNEAEWRKCFYLNLEFGLETTFQRRRQEIHGLNKIELSEISKEQRADLNSYVSKCLEWIHYSSEKDITLDALKERLVQLWREWYSLVIIDTFSKIEGNMWNNAWWFQNKCMSELTDLCRRTWLAVLSIHHTNKLKKFSGSQKIFDLSKVFYTISNVPGDNSVRAYECTKDKFGSVNIGDPLIVSYKAWEYSLYKDPF